MLPCATIYNGASRALKGLIWSLALLAPWATAAAEPAHGIAMHGAPRYGPDFEHLSYVNPDAPKGGRLVLSALGSFDSLNPLIVKGVAAGGLRGYVFESLMARAYDEPFSLYGLLAETVDTPADRSSVAFTLRAEARSQMRGIGAKVTHDWVDTAVRALPDEAFRVDGPAGGRAYLTETLMQRRDALAQWTNGLDADSRRRMQVSAACLLQGRSEDVATEHNEHPAFAAARRNAVKG